MYFQLSFRNLKKSLRDYIIFFVTLVLISCLMYAFINVAVSEEILLLSDNIKILTKGILISSVIISMTSFFIINYVVCFMLQQRKREFATYFLLGMELNKVCFMFLVENIALGSVALLLGISIGGAISRLLKFFIIKTFSVEELNSSVISLKAILITIVLFLIVYLVCLLKTMVILKKAKLIDLFSDSKKNDTINLDTGKIVKKFIFYVGALIICGLFLWKVLSTVNIQRNKDLLYIAIPVIVGLISIYQIHYNISALFVILQKRKNISYNGTNLFFLGQIRSKLNHSRKEMGVIALLLVGALLTLFLGMVMGAGYKANIRAYYPYDVGVAVDASIKNFNQVIDFIDAKSDIEESVSYYLYEYKDYPKIEMMLLSDYNALRKQLRLDEKILQDDEYLIQCDTWFYMENIKKYINDNPNIKIGDRKLSTSTNKIATEPMEQYQMAGTKGYVMVVPDDLEKELIPAKSRLVVSLRNGGYPELKGELNNFMHEKWIPELREGVEVPEHVTLGISVKAWGKSNSLSGFLALSLVGMYLSIVFMIYAATILCLKYLSTIDRNRRNYKLLYNLGVDNRKKILKKEMGCYFLCPLCLPVLITGIAAFAFHHFLGQAILQDNISLMYLGISLGIFFIVYLLYYLLTILVYNKSVIN